MNFGICFDLCTDIKMTYFIGSHIGKDKKGWIQSLQNVHRLGGNAVQIFTSSPMARMSQSTFDEYKTVGPMIKNFIQEHGMRLFIHSSYTLNFAKDSSQEYPYWIDAMVKDLQIADMIGAEGCVLHLGKAVSQTQEKAIHNMYTNVCRLLDKAQELGIKAKLFLETSSGQGTEILVTSDNTIHHLANFFKMFDKKYHKNLSFCVDTCHIYAAGYDIGTAVNVARFFEEWKTKIGLHHLGIIHFNNSVHGLGSRKDRHACINFGKIPIEGLVAFAVTAMQHGIPLVLETPAGPLEITVLQEISLNSENQKDIITEKVKDVSPSMVNVTICEPKKVVKKLNKN